MIINPFELYYVLFVVVVYYKIYYSKVWGNLCCSLLLRCINILWQTRFNISGETHLPPFQLCPASEFSCCVVLLELFPFFFESYCCLRGLLSPFVLLLKFITYSLTHVPGTCTALVMASCLRTGITVIFSRLR